MHACLIVVMLESPPCRAMLTGRETVHVAVKQPQGSRVSTS